VASAAACDTVYSAGNYARVVLVHAAARGALKVPNVGTRRMTLLVLTHRHVPEGPTPARQQL
jgi:hypothetical protein